MAAKMHRSRRGAVLTRGLFIASGLWLLFLTSGKAILDLDGNGTSDIWEEFYGQSLPADEDFDGDGLTNGQEYDRGTNPMVKDSSAESITIVPDPTSGHLSQFRFFGGIARTFTVEETTDLVSNPWSEAGTVPGNDTTILMEENLTSDKKFFRMDPQGAIPDQEPPGTRRCRGRHPRLRQLQWRHRRRRNARPLRGPIPGRARHQCE